MKKGFTLIELLVVISIIGFIALIAIPATVRILNANIDKTMQIQLREVKDASLLYLEDYCKSPINSSYICPLSKTITNGIATFNGEITLNTLVEKEYIDKLTIRDQECTGTITFSNNKPTVTLRCGDLYQTE